MVKNNGKIYEILYIFLYFQTCSEDEIEDYEPCHPISVEERLIKTYPIWYLPDLQRSGAVHLLQGKEEGVSIINMILPYYFVIIYLPFMS